MKNNKVFDKIFETENAQIKAHPRAYVIMAALEELQAAGHEIDRRGAGDTAFVLECSIALLRGVIPDQYGDKTSDIINRALELAHDSDKMLSTKAELIDEYMDAIDAQDIRAEFDARNQEAVELLSLVVMKHKDQNTQAAEIGIDPDRFGKFVRGELLPDLEERKKIAAYFEVSEKSIWG